MTLKSVSMVTAVACALAIPAVTARAMGDQARERRPPEVRDTSPDDQARERRPGDAQARARQRPAPRPAPRVVPRPTSRGSIVFIGGYYYDPFFGPYPVVAAPAPSVLALPAV